ncbi:peptidylprolyl isomerase [Anaerobacillus sp. HL2]|nr:peptidylprolyl isomerase [Anaerobacillus sp. HL2]
MGQAKNGEDFAKLAQRIFKDPGSAQAGGDLGSFERGRMVPEFEAAAFSSKLEKLIEPVQTQHGTISLK